jgi:hypothetical protein
MSDTNKPLIKKHSYKESTFEIKVNLNFKIERSMNGKREHLISIYSVGDTPEYNETHLVETHNLKEIIGLMIEEVEKWVDRKYLKNKSPEETMLISIGFEYDDQK